MMLFPVSHFRFKLLPVPIIALSFSACQPHPTTATPTTPETASATTNVTAPIQTTSTVGLPVYRIGVDPSYQPFINKNKNGEIEGFDVDLLNEISKREGFLIQLQPKPWSGIFQLLHDKHLDIVMGGAVATDERREKWAISQPYAQVTTVLITKTTSSIRQYEDAKDKKVAYTKGGSVENALKKLQATDLLDENQNFDSAWLRVKSVMAGTSDAAIGTSASFEYYVAHYPEQQLRVIYPPNPEFNDVVFITHKDNQALLNKLNKGLETLKQDGTLAKLQKKWLTPTQGTQ